MKKLSNKKGFTLAELLIVVAIIAVLVAIAIPVFGTSLNKAKVAADAANIRAGYAQVAVKSIESGDVTDATYYLKQDGSVAPATGSDNFKCQGKAGAAQTVGGTSLTWDVGNGISYTIASATGVITVAAVTG